MRDKSPSVEECQKIAGATLKTISNRSMPPRSVSTRLNYPAGGSADDHVALLPVDSDSSYGVASVCGLRPGSAKQKGK